MSINVYAVACYIDQAVAQWMPVEFRKASNRISKHDDFFAKLRASPGEKYLSMRIVAPLTLSGSQMFEGFSESLREYGVTDEHEIKKIQSALGSSLQKDSRLAFRFNGTSSPFTFSVQPKGSPNKDNIIDSQPVLDALLKIYFGSPVVKGFDDSILRLWGSAVKKLLPEDDGGMSPSLPLDQLCDSGSVSCFPASYPSSAFALGAVGVRRHDESAVWGTIHALVDVYSIAAYFDVLNMDTPTADAFGSAAAVDLLHQDKFFTALETSPGPRSYLLRILPSGLPQAVKVMLRSNSISRTQMAKGLKDSIGRWLQGGEGDSALQALEQALPESMPQNTFIVFSFPSKETSNETVAETQVRQLRPGVVVGTQAEASAQDSFDIQTQLPGGKMSEPTAISSPALARALQRLWFSDCTRTGEDCIAGFRDSLAAHWDFLLKSRAYALATANATSDDILPPPAPSQNEGLTLPWYFAVVFLVVGCLGGGLCTCCGRSALARISKSGGEASAVPSAVGTELRGLSSSSVVNGEAMMS
eukprot:TRINITY_DN27135_c0_g1_i3.p1 TRINITY_DN27135_c0_g1~~TRINITY_DN27135_c0_g1_i3.p1  ORF type:complete len:591 (-),score=111.88 TRINITY_DN27135_c0_g1_i3:3-1592(-)